MLAIFKPRAAYIKIKHPVAEERCRRNAGNMQSNVETNREFLVGMPRMESVVGHRPLHPATSRHKPTFRGKDEEPTSDLAQKKKRLIRGVTGG